MILRSLYTAVWYAAAPLIGLRLLWRARRQPEYLQHLGERVGVYRISMREPVIWLHAVSVGETRACAPLLQALLDAHPDHTLLLTHMTPTGRATAAELFGEDKTVIPLTPSAEDPTLLEAVLTATLSQKYRLHLVDEADRGNKNPPWFTVTVQSNQLAKIEVVFPKRDIQVSSLQELPVEAKISDDLSVLKSGAVFSINGNSKEIIFKHAVTAPLKKQEVKTELALEKEHAKLINDGEYDKAAAKIDAAHGTDFGIDTIVGIVTRNPIASAVDGDMLGIIFFGLMFGAAVSTIRPDRRQAMTTWLEALADVVTTIIDFAILSIGAVTVPIYETSAADQIRHVLADSGAVLAIAEADSHAAKIESIRAEVPALGEVLVIDGGATAV